MADDSRKNVEFLAIDPKLECSWIFYVPAEATMLSDVPEELLTLAETVFEAAGPIFILEALEYSGGRLARDLPVEDLFQNDREERPIVSREELDFEGKPNIENLEATIKQSLGVQSGLWFLTMINVTRGATIVDLKTGSETINRASQLAKTWRNESVDVEPSQDPLSFDIRLSPPYEDFDSTDHYYTVQVSTSSDIWFENTDIGRRNRNRLSRVLNDIRNQLDTVQIKVRSNRHIREKLLNLLNEPSDENRMM